MIKKTVLTILCMGFVSPVFSCLIVVISDGQRVLVGNHEDWFARDARVIFTPPQKGTYGHVLFDFASEGYAQGGMNTQGLFFDGTATPYVPISFPDKPVFDGYIWKALLEKCANIEEALDFLTNFKLPDLEAAHILLADRSGQSIVLGAYDGELTIHSQKAPYYVLTNFNPTDPEYGGETACPRYHKAVEMLEINASVSIETVRSILSETHQEELSVYSNIYDLTDGDIYIFQLADFQRVARFNLFDELEKGEHSFLVTELDYGLVSSALRSKN